MKPTRFLFAACVLSGAPLLAAPATPTPPIVLPASGAAVATMPFDARAVALLDQSIKAYGALDKLSQNFVIVDSENGVVEPRASGSGTLMIQKPNNARLEVKYGDKNWVFVTDGAAITSQMEPTSYQKVDIKDDAIGRVISVIPSAANLPLGTMLSGANPLTAETGMKWQSATLTPKDGLDGVTMMPETPAGRNPVAFRVYLDPKTHLIARVEAGVTMAGKPGEADKTFSNVTTFTPSDAAITPATFQFVPAPGVTLVKQAARPKSYDERLVVGAKPFALGGKTLEGQALSLDSYKGKVVLLDFWATWCGPCIGELPNVKTNYEKYKPQGFDIVGVSLDEEEAALRGFVQEKALPWPQIFDGKGWEAGDAQTYGVRAIPFTLLIGKDGTIAAVNPRGKDLEPAIQAALAQ